MMKVIVEICRAFALTVTAKKAETMYMPPPHTSRTMVRVETAGQIYKQVHSFTYHGDAVIETPGISVEIARRTCACRMRIRRYLRELYDQPKVALSLKTRMVKAEAIEALYGCSTWTRRQENYAKLRTVYHLVLLRIIGAQRKRPDFRIISYNRALEITRCESIEITLRTRRLLWAGTLIQMSGRRLPKRITFGNLEGAVRIRRGGEEKEWTDCVQSDIRAFDITGGWKATTFKLWVDTVTEGGRRFVAARLDTARTRDRQRGWESCYRTRRRRILRNDTHCPSRRVEGILIRTRDGLRPALRLCMLARRVAFIFIFSERAPGGGGVRCQTMTIYFFLFLFSRPQAGMATV